MRTFSALLAAAILGEIAADAQKAVQDITSVLHPIGEEDGATKALETLKLKVDAKGCYHLTGPDSGLSLLLCEDDAGARKRYTDEGIVADLAAFPATNEDTYSWVNGTITNLGEVAICSVAFASRDTDLTTEALELVPINLPTTALDEALFGSVDLAPGEAIEFAYFLPFDDARNAPAFVGLANSLKACPEAKEKFVPELPELKDVAADATETVAGAADQVVDAAGDAVDATQETTAGVLDTVQEVAKELVDGTQEKLEAAIDSLQSVLKQPEEEAAAPADTTTTIPTTTEDKPVAQATGDAKAADADAVEDAPKAAEPPVAELPTKEAQKEAEATSPAGTRSASGSVLLLGMIAALSVVALFA